MKPFTISGAPNLQTPFLIYFPVGIYLFKVNSRNNYWVAADQRILQSDWLNVFQAAPQLCAQNYFENSW